MSSDPAFLFYPGDYLRDTQCLSEKTQVAYDRIMCEHMRNICIRQAQLNFFTKRLNSEEISELKNVLTEKNGCFQISWVAESIEKRRDYSESRRKNRLKKSNNICKSYDKHMEIEIENVNKEKNGKVNYELTETNINSAIEYLAITKNQTVNKKYILSLFRIFKEKNLTSEKFYNHSSDIFKHFMNSLKFEINGKKEEKEQPSGPPLKKLN